MNINKHLILLFSVLFFLFAVSVSSGCFRKNESDVKSVVRNELDQLKNLDSETTQKYIPYTELFPDATENTDLTDEINETFSLFFRKFNYKISDVIVEMCIRDSFEILHYSTTCLCTSIFFYFLYKF